MDEERGDILDWFVFFICLTGYVAAMVVNISWAIEYERLNRDWCQTCKDEIDFWYEENIKLIDEYFGDEDEKKG